MLIKTCQDRVEASLNPSRNVPFLPENVPLLNRQSYTILIIDPYCLVAMVHRLNLSITCATNMLHSTYQTHNNKVKAHGGDKQQTSKPFTAKLGLHSPTPSPPTKPDLSTLR